MPSTVLTALWLSLLVRAPSPARWSGHAGPGRGFEGLRPPQLAAVCFGSGLALAAARSIMGAIARVGASALHGVQIPPASSPTARPTVRLPMSVLLSPEPVAEFCGYSRKAIVRAIERGELRATERCSRWTPPVERRILDREVSRNVDVLRRMLQAFNDGDVEAIVAECDPAVEWEEQFIAGVEPIYRGHDGVRRWWAETIGEELGPIEGRFEGVKEADDTVIASVRFEGEGRSSGVRVPMLVHIVGTFRGGKLVRRQVFLTLAEALEAVELRE
jgi:ketosteroid isomerase-like protein